MVALASITGHDAHAAVAPSVQVQAPARNFGYFIGDTMEAAATITGDAGSVLDPASLPAEGPISTWIDLRRIIVSQRDSTSASQLVLHMEYQSFFDPEEASLGTVPGFDVSVVSHGQRVSVHVPGFGFMASPFRHVVQPVIESSALRPDHGFLEIPLDRLKTLTLAALAVAVAAAVMLVARLGLLAAMRGRGRPFAAASRRIGRLARQADAHEAAGVALLELHRAFDATAGRRMLAPDVGGFLAKHTQFGGLKEEIECFFAASRIFFFGATRGAAPELDRLKLLGRRLRRAERAS